MFESPRVTVIFLRCMSNEDTTMLNTCPSSPFDVVWPLLVSPGWSFLQHCSWSYLISVVIFYVIRICLLFLLKLFHVYNVIPPSHQNLRSQLCQEHCSVSPSLLPWARGASSKPCQPALHLSFRLHPVVNVTLFPCSVYKAVAPGGQGKSLAGFVLGVVGTKSVLIR